MGPGSYWGPGAQGPLRALGPNKLLRIFLISPFSKLNPTDFYNANLRCEAKVYDLNMLTAAVQEEILQPRVQLSTPR